PKIFFVNWFRKDRDGKFIWPGFGENARVLKWVSQRLDNTADAQETAIGFTPTKDALDLSGLSLSNEALDTLLGVDLDIWDEEAALVVPHYEKFGAKLPKRLWDEHKALVGRLKEARSGTLKAAAARRPNAPKVTAKGEASAN